MLHFGRTIVDLKDEKVHVVSSSGTRVGGSQLFTLSWILGIPAWIEKVEQMLVVFSKTRLFYKKLRIWASIESVLKLSDFEFSELRTILTGSVTIFICFLFPRENFKTLFLRLSHVYRSLKYLGSTMIQETSGNIIKNFKYLFYKNEQFHKLYTFFIRNWFIRN